MINRLPLDLFDDPAEPDESAAPSGDPSPEAAGEAIDQILESPSSDDDAATEAIEPRDILLVTCQWCSAQFDNELPACPECNAAHVPVQPPEEEPTTVTCQWCLTTFDIGPDTCPECNARVVIPGQNVPGEHDVPLDFNRLGMASRNAHSQQMLVGMMASGGLDMFAAGLIGLALTVLDDD